MTSSSEERDPKPRSVSLLPNRIRVLHAEDVRADAELSMRELKRAGLAIEHRIVDSEETFARELREFAPEVILSDFAMPSFDGMAALTLARELAPDTPFIFVSGTIGEEYAIRALKNGAIDYVLKTNLVRLPAAVERAIRDASERRERRRLEQFFQGADQVIRSWVANVRSWPIADVHQWPLSTAGSTGQCNTFLSNSQGFETQGFPTVRDNRH